MKALSQTKTATTGPYRAFTLIDLLVVLVLIAFWAAVLAPSLANVRSYGPTIQCLNNVRQLASAWKMYADDNNGQLPPSGDIILPGWVNGGLTWGLDSDNTNTLNLTNARLGAYTRGDVKIYRCPAADFLSQAQRAAGWERRVRSTSMNAFLEGGQYNDSSGGSHWNPSYFRYDRISDIVRPAPSDLWLFLDEHPDSIGDGIFVTDMVNTTRFIDLPASYHNGGCNFSFADGHAQTQCWKERTTIVPVTYKLARNSPTAGQLRDITWMQQHASARR